MKISSSPHFSRRRFCQLLLMSSAMTLTGVARAARTASPVSIKTLSFPHEVGGVPNDRLPLLLYQQAVPSGTQDVDGYLSTLFERHNWPVQWRYHIFPFTHYHSNTHELLGVSQGSARVQLGGVTGPVVSIQQGDAILIPAGVGHKQIEASDDFLVLGAYPRGLSPDLYHDDPSKLAESEANIARIAMPEIDPIMAQEGGIRAYWSSLKNGKIHNQSHNSE